MPAIPFTQQYVQRDVDLSTLVGQVGHLALLCMIKLADVYPQPIKSARLAFMFRIKYPKRMLDPVLDSLYTYGYATPTGPQASRNWHITDAGRKAVTLIASTATSTDRLLSPSQLALPIGNAAPEIVDNSTRIVDNRERDFRAPPDLSSSIRIDPFDQDRSSIDSEEENAGEKISEPARRSATSDWCAAHDVGGEKLRSVLADPFCTADRLELCIQHWTREGRTAKGELFRNAKYGPLNYAIACCLNHDVPPLPSPSQGEGQGEGSVSPHVSPLPAGYTPALSDPVFDKVLVNLAQHYGDEIFMSINPRLVCTDEHPNRFTVLVDSERPELKAQIASLVKGFSRKSYAVTLVTEWPTLTTKEHHGHTDISQDTGPTNIVSGTAHVLPGKGAAFDALKRSLRDRAQ